MIRKKKDIPKQKTAGSGDTAYNKTKGINVRRVVDDLQVMTAPGAKPAPRDKKIAHVGRVPHAAEEAGFAL